MKNCPNCQKPLRKLGSNHFCLNCDYDDLRPLPKGSIPKIVVKSKGVRIATSRIEAIQASRTEASRAVIKAAENSIVTLQSVSDALIKIGSLINVKTKKNEHKNN